MKEMVGLGRISFPGKRLSAEAMDRAASALSRFKDAAMQYGAEKIVTVATSAVREAINGGVLIERLRRELKLHVRVVSAREEARLIYLGVRHAYDLGKDPNLIVDIGGGSVEFIVGNVKEATLLESRKLGAARITSTFVKSDPLSKADRKAIEAHYAAQLDALLEQVRGADVKRVVGTSGTMENLARLCGDLDDDGKPLITRKSFKRVLKQLLASDAAAREGMTALDAHRKEQVVAAAMLVDHLFDRLDLKRIQLCDFALREGIIVDHLAKHVPDLHVRREVPDPRRRSVLDLARRCHWFEVHSTHVTALALRLFDQLRELHELGDPERELIEFASMLHDIGWHIAPDGHHKHAMYLIQNANLGESFSREELNVMANVARYHRKSAPTDDHPSYADLGRRERRIVDVGAALLRIADGLDRSHSSAVSDVKVRILPDGVMCRLEVRSDAELEMWDAKRKSDWFEKLFGRPMDFEMPG
jgi:exopolyphosphatase/guanosine-5'-triphosphate,3'-diphosphate pyrophosphatase